eukprot:GHRR01031194.1.p1 GENE.GHRR01031194.1~~GHRR01031194.1.p1  ORF type:complete len:144 (+),score=32.01 GHRR01031194.1:117-548(+)
MCHWRWHGRSYCIALTASSRSSVPCCPIPVVPQQSLLHMWPAGFTHLQQAQTVRWGHWLMSHAAGWQRDDMRVRDLLPRVATLPLGSGALAGNPFLVDRQFLAQELGMIGGVCPNSMDAVSDRKWAWGATGLGCWKQIRGCRM